MRDFLRREREPRAWTVTLEPGAQYTAAYQRRRRRGTTRSGNGPVGSVPVQARNGLPDLVPYAYRGTGADVLAGTYGDRRDEPYWDGRP